MFLKLVLPLLAISFLSSGLSEAAIFRIQDSTWNYNQADSNSSGAKFANGVISGDFHINTDYKDAAGNTVSAADNNITAWNIRISGSASNFTFAKGGNHTASYDPNLNSVLFSDGENSATTLTIQFGGSILDRLGNTIDPDGTSVTANDLWYQTITSATYSATPLGAVDGAVGAQADFVPYSPVSFVLLPPIALVFKLRKKSRATLG